MNCLSYIPGEGLHVDFHFTIKSLAMGTVSLWVLVDDELLQSWGNGAIINQSNVRAIAICNETKLFDTVTRAIERAVRSRCEAVLSDCGWPTSKPRQMLRA